MAGTIRLFEKDVNGLLHEVPPADVDARRQGHMVSRVSLQVDVLWTAEEEAARAAEEAAAVAARMAREQAKQQLAADLEVKRAAAQVKLDNLGLTVDDLRALVG